MFDPFTMTVSTFTKMFLVSQADLSTMLLDTMNSPTAFLVAVLILFIVSCVKSDKECEISDSDAIIATTNAMKKCNSNIKHCFDFHQGKAVEKLYCRGMMKLIRCVYKEAKDFAEKYDCRSRVLERWVFVVLQYCIMGSRLDICQGENSYTAKENEHLKELADKFDTKERFKGIREFSVRNTIIPDEDKECARNIHTECAEKLVKAGTSLCANVNNFVTCYDNFIGGSTPLPPSCTKSPEITKEFAEVIDLFSKYLINLYEADTQHNMCKVDDKVLDGDCM